MTEPNRRSELNKELNKYISDRRTSPSRFSALRTINPTKPKIEEKVEPEDLPIEVIDKEPFIDRIAKIFSKKTPVEPVDIDEFEEVEHVEEHIHEQETGGFFRKFAELLGFGKEIESIEEEFEEEEPTEEPPIDKEDMKTVLKISHKYLNRLPKRIKDEFKESDDYQSYISIIQKYGLGKIKEKKD